MFIKSTNARTIKAATALRFRALPYSIVKRFFKIYDVYNLELETGNIEFDGFSPKSDLLVPCSFGSDAVKYFPQKVWRLSVKFSGNV